MGDKSPKDKTKGSKQKDADRAKADQKLQAERDAKAAKPKK